MTQGLVIKNNIVTEVSKDINLDVIIPQDIKEIGDHAFAKTKIKSIIINEGLVTIHPFAFYECTELEKVILPSTIKHISMHAFDGCTNIKEIIIPKDCFYVGWYAFNKCISLTIHYLGESIPKNWSNKWNNQNCEVILGK